MKFDKKEVGISIVKAAFSNIPYVGQILSEVVFEYRGRIKQERLNKFTELLSEHFSVNSNFDIENMQSEDFSDLLESVLKRVVLTKSEAKLKRFRDVLVHNLDSVQNSTENSELYLSLISSLNEKEIHILQNHMPFDKKYNSKKEQLKKLRQELIRHNEYQTKHLEYYEKGYANEYDPKMTFSKQQEKRISVITEELDSLNHLRKPKFYGISEDEFLYCKQKLQSLGLLVDSGAGGIGTHPFDIMNITEFGKDFIKFIYTE